MGRMGRIVGAIALAATGAGGLLVAQEPAVAVQEAEQSLRETELAFARTVAEKSIDGFLSFVAEDAVFTGGGKILRGREEIAKAWSIFFAPDSPPLTWHPETVAVLTGGDLGLTTGPYETTVRDTNGRTVAGSGTFFSVWRRQADGTWRIILDGGTPPLPHAGAGPRPSGP